MNENKERDAYLLKCWLEYDEDSKGSKVLDDAPEKLDREYWESFGKIGGGWGTAGKYGVVGHGVAPSPNCGKLLRVEGCLRVDLHNQRTLDGCNHAGEVYVRKVFWHCDKPDCPICFKSGWAVREAGAITERLKEASKRFGQVEHVVVSIPEVDFGLDFERLRKKVVGVLSVRKIFGGVLIAHMFRYANRREALLKGVPFGWRFSPHFHLLGFVTGGFGRCRGCENFAGNGEIYDRGKCLVCDGFEGCTRRAYDKEGGRSGAGYIVKVFGERKTVRGTAWYQLSHASFRRGGKRNTVAFWFGTCSYRKMKLERKDVREEHVCPLCGYELERVMFLGAPIDNPLSVDRFWVTDCWDKEKDSDGSLRWMLKPERD